MYHRKIFLALVLLFASWLQFPLAQEAGGDTTIVAPLPSALSAQEAGGDTTIVPLPFALSNTDWQGRLKEAKSHRRAERYDEALDALNGLLSIHRKLAENTKEITVLIEIGRTYRDMNQPRKALEYFEQTLAKLEPLNKPGFDARVLNYIGMAHRSLGQYPKAVTAFSAVLEIEKATSNAKKIARALTNLGVTYFEQSRYADALAAYRDARTELKKHEAKEARSAELLGPISNNTGLVYSALGQYEKAREFHYKALELYERLENKAAIGTTQHNIGFAYAEEGDFVNAIVLAQQALATRREVGDQDVIASTLNNIGFLYGKTGEYDKALPPVEEALKLLERHNDNLVLGRTLDTLGDVYLGLNRYNDAQITYSKALFLRNELGDRTGERSTLANLGKLFEAQDLKSLAITFYKLAVNVSEAIRGSLRELPRDQRQSYAEKISETYEGLASLLIEQGRLLEAEQVLSLLKQEEYQDFVRSQGTQEVSLASLNSLESEVPTQYSRFSSQIIALGTKKADLLQNHRDGVLTPEDKARFKAVQAELGHAIKAFKVFLDDLKVKFKDTVRDRDREFPEGELKALPAFQETLAKLGEHTVALYFLSTQEKLHIILTSGNMSIPTITRQVAIPESQLDKLIVDYRVILQNPSLDPSKVAKQLHDILVKPVEADLVALKAKTLLVYLDGKLRYLPLAALHDGTGFLIQKYSIVMYTPAVKDKLLIQPVATWRVAGLGVSEEFQNFRPLAGVVDELDGIVKEEDADSRGVLPGKTYLNQYFTKDVLSSALVFGDYPVIHMASHFHFGGTAEDSFILLGGGEKLRLSEFELNSVEFPMNAVDLLTLSACETALGTLNKRDGREVEGFGALAQYNGAKSVLATLWKVADQSTGLFMQLLYQLKQRDQLTKAEALSRVQQMFINGEENAQLGAEELQRRNLIAIQEGEQANFVFNPDAPYAHPFFWAPFILMGNFL